MSVQVRRRREAASFLSTFVGAQGELLVDTTNNRVQVHDGATPGGWPAARLAEVLTNTRTSVADAAYTALVSDRTIAVTSLTAARTIILPSAATYPTGTQLLVFDESGACSAANTITIARAGTDVVNGGASVSIAVAYGYLALESNGSGRWTVVDQTPSTSGGGSRTAVADANYTAQAADRLIAYTALTAARTVTLPSSNAFPTGAQLFVIDETGLCSTTNTLTVVGSGMDTINGATSTTIAMAYGYLAFESNGAGKWTLIDQAAAASSGTLRTPVADANYAALTTDRVIGYTSLTTTRTVTLPAAAAFAVGTRLLVLDEGGYASATVAINIARTGSDTIDGGTSAVISTAYGYVAMQSNGTSKWTVVDQATVPTTALTGSLQAGLFPAFGGDVTTPAGSLTTTLATVNGTPGTFGGASAVPVVTVNGKGQTTGVTTAAVVAPAGTLSGATLAANVTGSALTSVGTLTGGGTGAGFTVALGASTVSGTLGLANGGVGATTPAAARSSLGAAASGANSDITSLGGLTTPLSIAQGGTGASGWRTAVSDASATATTASRTIAYTAITAARVVSLPAASSFPTGTPLTVVDESGACSGTNSITLAANGSDKINGAASLVLSLAYGYVAIESNGAGAWTVIDQSTAGMAQQAPGGVVITGGAINGTGIGQSNPAAVAATNFSATGTVALPANSVTLAAMVQAPAGTLRGNLGGSATNVSDNTLTAYLDAAFGASQGAVLLRSSSGWTALAPGTSGYVLTSNGTAANPTYQAAGASAALPRSTVRQTVQGGPQSSGAPSFLPGSSANLNLTAQNISTGASALTVAAAQGYNSTGQNDIITQITSNPTWSSLTASTTVYLYVNAASGATGSTTLQPIYQFGGAISTASGQFTFDYQAMIGWMGNGSAAVATPLVFVGEIVTSSSAVTATTAYAYDGYYESASVSGLPGTATSITRNHNLGLTPQGQPDIVLTCVTADQGFAVGSTLHAAQFYTVDGNGRIPVVIGVTRATLTSITGNSAPFAVLPYSGGNGIILTSANWSYKAIVRRGWGGA